MVRTVIENLSIQGPGEQRKAVIGRHPDLSPTIPPLEVADGCEASAATPGRGWEGLVRRVTAADDLLRNARSTAADGRQRGAGATDPTDLEVLRDGTRPSWSVPPDDATRFVLPWHW